jgi:hypothetical protein
MKLRLGCDFCKLEIEVASYVQRPPKWHEIVIGDNPTVLGSNQLTVNSCEECSKRIIPSLITFVNSLMAK